MMCSRRLDLVNDGVMSNSAVKLLVLEAQLEARMDALRRQEEMHLLWYNASTALTVFIQVTDVALKRVDCACNDFIYLYCL